MVTAVTFVTEQNPAYCLLYSYKKEGKSVKQNFNINQYLWIFPFLAFFAGYLCLQIFIVENSIKTPHFVGINIAEAIKISSHYKLNLRIVAEKEVADMKPGTILKQKPESGKWIKENQSIFIVITKTPQELLAPRLIDKDLQEVEETCNNLNIKNNRYDIETSLPANQCFAQFPSPSESLETKKISSYIAINNKRPYLFPDVTDYTAEEVVPFLQKYNIKTDVYYKHQKVSTPFKKNFIIKHQKPLAGTFVTPNEKLYVQLQVVIENS